MQNMNHIPGQQKNGCLSPLAFLTVYLTPCTCFLYSFKGMIVSKNNNIPNMRFRHYILLIYPVKKRHLNRCRLKNTYTPFQLRKKPYKEFPDLWKSGDDGLSDGFFLTFDINVKSYLTICFIAYGYDRISVSAFGYLLTDGTSTQ